MRKRFVSSYALGCALAPLLLEPSLVFAQAPPPPPPVPPAADEADPYAEEQFEAEEPVDETPATTTGEEAQTADPEPGPGPGPQTSEPEATASVEQPALATATEDPYGQSEAVVDDVALEDEIAASNAAREQRLKSLRRQSTLSGSTGLFRVREAGSSAAGTFRVNVQIGLNAMGGFLCHAGAPCPDPVTGAPRVGDASARTDTRASLSVTPFPFLEAFAGFRNVATSNDFGRPRVVNIMGDWNFGAKVFLPEKEERIVNLGGELELSLLNGAGGVGFDPSATGFAARGLAGLDFSRAKTPLPLRFSGSVGYLLDNSAQVIDEFEKTPPAQGGRGQPIARTERYGLDFSRVDSLEIGLGAEYMTRWVRPFVEWTIEVPVNRQAYVCNPSGAASRGDLCLGLAAGFDTTPSRLTLGARAFPWQASGLGVSLALDIGTGHTQTFIEEAAPEAPYTFWLGLSYAIDATPIPEIRKVEVLPETAPLPQHRYAFGRVIDEKTGAAIGDAQLRFSDGSRTGLISGEAGTFMTGNLPPGVYDFNVTAHEYLDSVCQLTVPENVPTQPSTWQDETQQTEGELASASDELIETPSEDGSVTASAVGQEDPTTPYLDVDGNLVVPIRCELKPLPQVATITGTLLGADSGEPVSDATVIITDKLDRSLQLAVDGQGAFQFRNVPFGKAHVLVTAPGYMSTVRDFGVASRQDINENIVLNPVPAKLHVKVTKKELSFTQPITFITRSANVAADSMGVIEELALVLTRNPDINQVEVQVHTDDSGEPDKQRELSQERAAEIRQLLLELGVAEGRVTAKGYGPDQPLAPNLSDAARARNNRVQVVIVANQ